MKMCFKGTIVDECVLERCGKLSSQSMFFFFKSEQAIFNVLSL